MVSSPLYQTVPALPRFIDCAIRRRADHGKGGEGSWMWEKMWKIEWTHSIWKSGACWLRSQESLIQGGGKTSIAFQSQQLDVCDIGYLWYDILYRLALFVVYCTLECFPSSMRGHLCDWNGIKLIAFKLIAWFAHFSPLNPHYHW